MISTPTRPIRRAYIPARNTVTARHDGEGAEALRTPDRDPAALAATLRDLAVRAHRAARAVDTIPSRGTAAVNEPLRELAELHPQIVELERTAEAATDRGVATYLTALRHAVEARLG